MELVISLIEKELLKGCAKDQVNGANAKNVRWQQQWQHQQQPRIDRFTKASNASLREEDDSDLVVCLTQCRRYCR